MTLEGIDVSSYQGYINWGQVKVAGKAFAMAKATEGLGYQDPTFPHNWVSMAYRGIQRLSYHFLRPSEDGTAQADYHHAYVRNSGHFAVGDGCMLDLEVTDGVDAAQVVRCAEKFVLRMLATTQCGIFLYTYGDFWINQLGSPESPVLARCPLALASYGPSYPALPLWPNGPSIWQYSETGHVPGIVGHCDLDRFLGTMAELHTLCREGGRH